MNEPRRIVDLSHEIEEGMITYPGLDGPTLCDYLSRERSRELYAPGTEFFIGQITMVANTGTYVDVPFHRYADGEDLVDVGVERLADLPGVVVHAVEAAGPIDAGVFADIEVAGRAVLVHTGWDRHWRTEHYMTGHPFLTMAAAEELRDRGVALVGIDSLNIDDTSGGERPVHSVLLAAGIPIVEHMTRLDQVPDGPFRFTAAPPKVRGLGSFPVRAFAVVGE